MDFAEVVGTQAGGNVGEDVLRAKEREVSAIDLTFELVTMSFIQLEEMRRQMALLQAQLMRGGSQQSDTV